MALDLNFSSPHYAEAVELALGPVLFMSVATLLNTALATRLAQVTDRAKFLRGDVVRHDQAEIESEIQVLLRRARLLHWAIRASSFGALMFAMVITLSFFAAFLQLDLSKVLAACFATALLSIVLALYSLLRETDVALNTLKL